MRAKFHCYSEERHSYGTTTYKLQPVGGGNTENEAFFRTTPTGAISVTVKNDETNARLTLGSEYFIDFIPVKEN